MDTTNNRMTDILKSGPFGFISKAIGARKTQMAEVAAVLFVSYVCATIASSFIASTLMEQAAGIKISQTSPATNKSASNIQEKKLNYMQFRKNVMGRNLFNSSGEVPDESAAATEPKDGGAKVFDPTAKCEKSKINLTLLGTIFMGSEENSLATVKEAGVDDADIYKPGDFIVGNDGAQIVAISRKKVVINNNGVKECLDIDEKEDTRTSPSFDPQGRDSAGASAATAGESKGAEVEGGCVTLEGGYVETELGDGFSKIMTAARLVPNMEENKVSGFKIFAINTSSIFGKVGFKNGDIVTQVNDTSLKLPEQGFALYEAFQDEREINIHVLRGGQTPKTLCVKIK